MGKTLTYKLGLYDLQLTNQGEVKKVLSSALHLSKREISRVRYDGTLLINGRPAKLYDHMKVSDVLTVIFPEDPAKEMESAGFVPQIVYEDEDLVIAEKPAGTIIHPSAGHPSDTLGTAITKMYADRGENFRIRSIGRLDYSVTGLQMFAKSQPAAARLSRQMDTGRLSKTFTAIVSGHMEDSQGTIDMPLKKIPGQAQCVIDPEGKPAVTHYLVRKRFSYSNKPYTLVELLGDTGRKHQLRLHLAAIGHPILGDELYGGDMSVLPDVALHCSEIRFYQPFTGEKLVIDSPLRADMNDVLQNREPTIIMPVIQESEPVGEEPAAGKKKKKKTEFIDTYAEDEPRKKKPNWLYRIFILAFLAAAGYLWYDRYKNNQLFELEREQTKQEVYDALTIEFVDRPVVEYGSQFNASDYVKDSYIGYSVADLDTKILGKQTAKYMLGKVTSYGNTVTRDYELDLEVVDTVPPVINLKSTRIEIKKGTAYDPNQNIVSVEDPVDGRLMQSRESENNTYYIDDSELDTSTEGIYVIRVIARDKSGNQSQSEFRVVVKEDVEDDETAAAAPSPSPTPTPTPVTNSTDKTAPQIMVKYASVDVAQGDTYSIADALMWIRDDVDGDLPYANTLSEGTYTVTTDLDTNKPGSYPVLIQAKDKAGNTSQEQFTVNVIKKADSTPAPTPTPTPTPQTTSTDKTAPQIMVRYASVDVNQGDTYSIGNGLMWVRDDVDGDLPYADVLSEGTYTVTTSLDTNKPGSYPVLIQAKDKAGNTSQEQFTVNVIKKAEPTSTSEPTPESTPETPVTVPDPTTAYNQIYSYLTGTMGLNRAAACGILAHMKRESGYNPTAYNPSGYYGLCQWGGGRYDNLKNWCDSNGLDYRTVQGQLGFMQMELEGYYSYVLNELKNVEDSEDGAYDAAYVFGMRYEVSGEYLANSAGEAAMSMYNQ